MALNESNYQNRTDLTCPQCVYIEKLDIPQDY